MSDPVRYGWAKIGFTAFIGMGLAFQSLPEAEQALFGSYAKALVSIILGGAYAVEKYLLKAPDVGKESQHGSS